MDYEVYFTQAQLFEVVFKTTLVYPDHHFRLTVDYAAEFYTTDPIDEVFRASEFPYLHAPAIAFPFLRSFIATLVLNAGYRPVLLPVLNFLKLREQKKKEAAS